MEPLTQIQIKEIAEQLDFGFRCFWNQNNNELVFIPDLIKYPEMEEEDIYQEDMEKIENNIGLYVEIEAMRSHDSFEIMTGFIDSLQDANKLKQLLMVALEKKKPFSKFKFTIDNSGPYRQQWFEFRDKKLIEWVCDKIDKLSKPE